MSKSTKGNPIPTKFDPPEEEALDSLKRTTGLSRSEIVRRAVRLLKREFDLRGRDALRLLIYELAPLASDISAKHEDDVARVPYGVQNTLELPMQSTGRKVSYSAGQTARKLARASKLAAKVSKAKKQQRQATRKHAA